jgi:hypothetical protein
MIWRVIVYWLLATCVVLADVPRHQRHSNNLMGEVVAMSDPDMGVWTYQRDYAGRMRGRRIEASAGSLVAVGQFVNGVFNLGAEIGLFGRIGRIEVEGFELFEILF